jgi:glycosyltransferase involved in cell wall biosynthesis
MNILYIVPYVPSQIYVRPYNLIRQLSAHGNQVTVLTISSKQEDKRSVQHLSQYCHKVIDFPLPTWRSYVNCLLALASSDPLQSAYCWQPDLIPFTLDLINKTTTDIIHIEHLRGARFGFAIKESTRDSGKATRSIPIIWDGVDCITHLFKQTSKYGARRGSRLITKFEAGRTARYEARSLNNFDHVLVTSQTDKNAMLSLLTSKDHPPKISVLPNGVDLDYFKPDKNISRENETLVISGKMSYHANITMVMYLINEIMPIVWSLKPTVQVWIVGKNPPDSIISLGTHPAITVTGTVDDMRPYLQRATISLAPLRYGAGIQNKVLESMACATPVITTSQGVNALAVKIGEDIIVADDPITFAEAIINLLENPLLRDRIGKAGRDYVEINHNWSNAAGRLEDIYNETIDLHLRSY